MTKETLFQFVDLYGQLHTIRIVKDYMAEADSIRSLVCDVQDVITGEGFERVLLLSLLNTPPSPILTIANCEGSWPYGYCKKCGREYNKQVNIISTYHCTICKRLYSDQQPNDVCDGPSTTGVTDKSCGGALRKFTRVGGSSFFCPNCKNESIYGRPSIRNALPHS